MYHSGNHVDHVTLTGDNFDIYQLRLGVVKITKMWRVRAGLGVLLLFFVGLSVCQPEPNGNYKYSVLLKDDAFAYYKLYWTVEEPHLRVAIVCKTTGWCAMGDTVWK